MPVNVIRLLSAFIATDGYPFVCIHLAFVVFHGLKDHPRPEYVLLQIAYSLLVSVSELKNMVSQCTLGLIS